MLLIMCQLMPVFFQRSTILLRPDHFVYKSIMHHNAQNNYVYLVTMATSHPHAAR